MNRSREDIYVPYEEEASMMRSDEEVDDEYDDDHDDDECVAAAPAQASIFLPAPITTVRARQDLCPKPNYAPVTVNDDDEDDVAGTCGTSPSHGATPPTKYLTTSARMAHHDHDRGHDHDGDDDVVPQMISLSSNSQAFWERPRSALYEPTAATAAKQHERTHTHKTSSPHSARKPPFLASGTAPSSGRRYSHATYEAAGSTYGRNDTTPTKYGGTYNNNNNNKKKRGCLRTFSPISTLSPRSAPQPQSQQTFVRKATMTPERKQSCDVRSLESFARHCSRQEAGRHDQYERTTPRYVRDAEASMASTEGGIELDGVRRKGARSRRGSSASSRPRASSANGGRLSRSQSCVSGLDPTTTTTTTLMRSNSTHKRGGAATRTSSTSSARKAETPSGYRCITTGGARKKTKKTNNNNKKDEVLTQHSNNGINQLSATPAKEESPAAVRCTWATSPGAIERMLVEDGEVEDELRRTGGAENARWSMSATKPRAPKSRGEMDDADGVGGATPTYGTTTTKGEEVDGCPAHIGSDPVLHVMLRGMIRFAMPCRLCGELLSDASYFNHVEMCATRTHDLLSAYYHARIPPHMTAVLRTAMDPLPPAMCANTNTNTNNVRSDAAWQCYHSARAMLVQCGVCRASIRVHDWREHEDQCRGTMRLPAQDPSPQHVKEEGNVRVC